MNKSTGTYINPLSPVYDLSYDPKGGSGILKAQIFVKFGDFETSIYTFLAYTYSETVNGIEVEVERPNFPNASSLDEDIYNSLKEEMDFDTINYIQVSDLKWR